jgi:hypothetical protein
MGGHLVKIARLLAIAILMLALMVATRPSVYAQTAPAASASTKLPQGWDPNIPLPPDAVLLNSTVPKSGVVYSADFAVKGDFKDLMAFYETNLPKAGFQMSSKVAMPARKVYNRNFTRGGRLDSVVLTPGTNDPSAFNLHFAWSPQAAMPPAATPAAKTP